MIYTASLSVPAKTAEDSPVGTELEIKEQIITKFELHFPSGCASLVKARVCYGPKVIWPQPEDAWLSGNDETISFPEHYALPEIPCVLRFEACSPEADYDHSIILRLGTVPEEAAKPWGPIQRFVQMLSRLFGG